MSEVTIDENLANDTIDNARKTFVTVRDITASLSLPKSLPAAFRLSLQSTILELGGAILHCLSAGILSASEILFRSFLEAYVDLLAAKRSADHVNHRQLTSHIEWRKVLQIAKRGGNPHLIDLTELPNLDELIEERKARIESLKANGAKDLYVEERFRAADEQLLYDGMYRRLSAASHNNFGELLRRHLAYEEGNVVDLTMFRRIEPHESLIIADTLTGILLGAMSQFEEHLTDEQKAIIESLSVSRMKVGQPANGG